MSINDYFNSNISKYKIKLINYETECISGNCEYQAIDNKTLEKNCYFCNSPLITEDKKRLELNSDRYSSGSMDAFAGCVKKYSGEEKEGFDIVSITNSQIKARGKISTYYSQNSTICNKMQDFECDDNTYGTYSGADYSAKYIREVYLIFDK